jgi:HSP20 family protein
MFGPLSTRLDWMEPFLAEGREIDRFVPPLDVWEDEKGLHVQAEVAGLAPQEIEVSFHEGVLTLKGEKKAETRESAHRLERRYGSFARSIEIPWEVDADKVEATFKDGLLSVLLPRTPKAQPKRIDVKGGSR